MIDLERKPTDEMYSDNHEGQKTQEPPNNHLQADRVGFSRSK